MNIEEMKKLKKEFGYSYDYIVEHSGVPLGTIQKIFTGVTKTPRYETLLALEKVFKKGKVDGVLYDTPTPTTIHQLIGLEICRMLKDYIDKSKGKAVTFMAPVDVQLDKDDRTMIQPDILVVCDRNKIKRYCIYGAPDLIVEILSTSTKRKDARIKLNKYIDAGVREYWMIDPDGKRIVVYNFEKDDLPVVYGFDAKIPVGIFNDECEIDFAEIYEYVKFLYDE